MNIEKLPIFRRDHYQRRQLFVEDSFQHYAKSNLYQLAWILNNFTAADDIILDPMGGTGSTFLGATLQRSVIVGEIEDYWISIMKRNKAQISSSFLFTNPMLAYQGNALNLPFGFGVISAVVTSPPYWDTFSDWHISSCNLGRQRGGPYNTAFGDDRGQETKRNIGNIHIYEDYLRAMATVYLEIQRVLVDDGILALILKDRIHKWSRVPIIDDTIALCMAMGFFPFARFDIPTRASQFRIINKTHYPDNPQIISEAIIVMRKCPPAGPGRKIAIIEGIGSKAKQGSGPVTEFFSSPIFRKLLAYAQSEVNTVYILAAKQGFIARDEDITDFDPQLQRGKAKVRREWIFDILRHQVMKGVFTAGDEITLCVSQRYARYLRQRLETLGCTVTEPLHGLNLGQQLAWLTERGF